MRSVPILLLLLASCGEREPVEQWRFGPDAPTTRFLALGDLGGRHKACGCAGGQLGGASRLTWRLASLRTQQPDLPLLLGGGFAGEDSPYGELQASLLTAIAELWRPLLCIPSPTDRALEESVMTMLPAADPGFQLFDDLVPLDAYQLLVLPDLPTTPIPNGTDLLLITRGGEHASLEMRSDGLPIVRLPERGRGLADITLTRADGRLEVLLEEHAIDQNLPEDPSATALTTLLFEEALQANDYVGLLGGKHDAAGAYAGTETCGVCHEHEYKVWSESSHAHAWDSLTAKGNERDPWCVRCHAVGYEEKGGYADPELDPDLDLTGVGCESCHGPLGDHVLGGPPRPLPTAETCYRCHDADNSPNFDFRSYWLKIRH